MASNLNSSRINIGRKDSQRKIKGQFFPSEHNEGSIIENDHHERHAHRKVIIDVDPGADDGMAILLMTSKLAKRERGINVIAITCVSGNTGIDNAVANTLKVLKTAGRLDIPVYKGANRPLLRNSTSDNFFGQDGFGDFYYEDAPKPKKYLQKEHAVLAMIRLVSQYPGEVTLLATGPLTNVALALKLYPNFIKDLKRLVVLGGSVNGVGNVKPALEFNFYFDPEAANIVLSAATKPICLVPWETVKDRTRISMDWRQNIMGPIQSPRIQLLNKAERIYNKTDDQWINADSFAALLVLRRDSSTLAHTKTFCGGNPQYAEVVVDCDKIGGAVIVDYANNLKKKPNIEIIEAFHPKIYKETVLRYLAKAEEFEKLFFLLFLLITFTLKMLSTQWIHK
ncbi:hypothetical protein J437_LFUL008326 [Ladona fulva]|uniref:Inosine/uridine-preferring nucleoside hydrolase domain-containing protein n=1 Tax=Ladona fulva TaxID=123851 RepID=A0A8K0NY77_LADFU|nr:hypothetical protein J437_LFUL008326 [Ladona fulva]